MFYKNTSKEKNKSHFLIGILIASSIALAGCGDGKKRGQDNFKISIEFLVDGQVYKNSVVQEIYCYDAIKWAGSMSSAGCDLKGEALPVKLGDNRYVFLIMDTPQYYVPALFKFIEGSEIKKGKKLMSWNVVLSAPLRFVTFDNLGDPKSVKAVYFLPHDEFDHHETYRPFPASQELERPKMKTVQPNASEFFGNGVSLKSIHVERTNEVITQGNIEAVLPWLAGKNTSLNLNGGLGSDKFNNSTLADELQHSNFKSRY